MVFLWGCTSESVSALGLPECRLFKLFHLALDAKTEDRAHFYSHWVPYVHHVFGFLGSSCLGSLPLPRLGNRLVLPTERQVPFPPVSFPIAVNITSIWGHQCSLGQTCFYSGESGEGSRRSSLPLLRLLLLSHLGAKLNTHHWVPRWASWCRYLKNPRAVNSLNRYLTGNNLDSVNHFWWTPLPSVLLPLSLVTLFLSASLQTVLP